MIHCGFGFSCQSPIQPTGSTVTKTVASSRVFCPIHCGAAGGEIDCRSNAVIAQRVWRLTPASSVQRCQ
jgi:hypothetical protein